MSITIYIKTQYIQLFLKGEKISNMLMPYVSINLTTIVH